MLSVEYKFSFLQVDIQFDVPKCIQFQKQKFKTLVVFLSIFVADTKRFFSYNFRFPLRFALTDFTSNYDALLEMLGRVHYGFMIKEIIFYRCDVSPFTRAPRHFIKKITLNHSYITLYHKKRDKKSKSINLIFPFDSGLYTTVYTTR